MTDRLSFASALRTLWQDSGLRQEEFAERLGYRRPTVANLLRGVYLPSLEFLNTVEAAFPGSREVLEPLLHRERQERAREKEQRAHARQSGMCGSRPERPVGLRPHIEHAFGRPHVSIDFAGFSGETLHGVMQEPLFKIRAGRLTPESITIRALLPDTSSPMTLPCRTDDLADDPGFRQRAGKYVSENCFGGRVASGSAREGPFRSEPLSGTRRDLLSGNRRMFLLYLRQFRTACGRRNCAPLRFAHGARPRFSDTF